MRSLMDWLPARHQPPFKRWLISTAVMAIAVTGQYAVMIATGLPGLFSALAGIAICGFVLDRWSAVYATVLGSAAAYATLEFYDDIRTISGTIVFGLFGLSIGLLADALRTTLERAEKSEKQKEILFRELSHRARNNLTMSAALLRLQANQGDLGDPKAALLAASNRLSTLAATQERIEVASDQVSMKDYLTSLCTELNRSFGENIRLDFEIDEIVLPQKKAFALGLITNELLTNSLKHGLGNRPGTVHVGLQKTDINFLRLTVRDDGPGTNSDARDGFGSQLIRMIATEHGGTVTKDVIRGYSVTVTMPL